MNFFFSSVLLPESFSIDSKSECEFKTERNSERYREMRERERGKVRS